MSEVVQSTLGNMSLNEVDSKTESRVIIVMGPPGAGKGTLCKQLASRYGFLHISTGDVFRDSIAKNTSLGAVANRYIQEGHFVPDELVVNLIKEKLSQDESKARGVLLDGFPRTERQASALASSFKVERVILMQVPQDTCLKRVLSRRVDPVTGDIYNLNSMPRGVSNEVKDRLVRREYDVDERIIAARLRTYYSQLGLVLTDFRDRIQPVNGYPSPAEVYAACCTLLDKPSPQGTKSERDSSLPSVPAANSEGGSAMMAADPAMKCSICFDEPAEYAVVPCGHQCGCHGCLTELQCTTSQCPICRKRISSILKVYRAGLGGGSSDDVDASLLPPMPPERSKNAIAESLLKELMAPQASSSTLSSSSASAAASEEDSGWGPSWGDEANDAGVGWGEAPKDAWCDGLMVSVEPVRDIILNNSDSLAAADGESNSNAATKASTATTSDPVDVAVLLDVADGGKFSREPVDVCCVIDVSGSMGSEAKLQDDDGELHGDGMSMLDIAKHAVKVVIEMLSDQDRLAIVSFCDTVKTEFSLGEMNQGGKEQAKKCLEKLSNSGTTNLWGGLLKGMDLMRECGETYGNATGKVRKQSLMLLTDGQPTTNPPRGYVAELSLYLDKHPNLNFQLNTFGFGYSLDCEILTNLAVHGRGTFAFVPDARILGTCFINAIANSICCCSQNNVLHLIPKNGAKFSGDVLGSLPVEETSWGRAVTLGPMVAGSYRDVVVPLDLSAYAGRGSSYLEAIVVSKHTVTGAESRVIADGIATKCSVRSINAAARGTAVTKLLDICRDASDSKGAIAKKSAEELCSNLAQRIACAQKLCDGAALTSSAATAGDAEGKNSATTSAAAAASAPQSKSKHNDLAAMAALLSLQQDVSGRISKALTTQQRYRRWGQHYLRAITRAHQLQQCTNYMDPGLQCYGTGELFKELVEKGGSAFVEMPPPVSTLNRDRLSMCSTTSTTSARNTCNMGTYYAGSGGGCFAPQCTVVLRNDAHIPQYIAVSELQSGDKVLCSGGSVARVKHIVRLTGEFKVVDMGKVYGGLKITPTHPVLVGGKWTQPYRVLGYDSATTAAGVSTIPVVYNVVLERVSVNESSASCSMIVNGVECITWGHGLSHSTGVAHAFYGTSAIVQYLGTMQQEQHGQNGGVIFLHQHELQMQKALYMQQCAQQQPLMQEKIQCLSEPFSSIAVNGVA